jgi:hypothetical protein
VVSAESIEFVAYPWICREIGWPPRPWLGRNGVASHFAKLASNPSPRYMRDEVDGRKPNLLHYFIAAPNVVLLRRP